MRDLFRWLTRATPPRPATPDVTVVIPVYNKAEYLEACLESVLGQSGITLEVVCVDDGSADGSAAILTRVARRERRVRAIRSDSNRGAARSRNIGIALARGKYVQFTDADDVLPEGALAALFRTAEETGSEAVKGNFQALRNGIVGPPGNLIDADDGFWPIEGIGEKKIGTILDLPEIWIPWFHVSYLISRGLLVRGGIEYPALSRGEDPVFIARVLTLARRICIMPQVVYTYRQGDHRPPPSLRSVQDYVSHAGLVREAYGVKHARCWETYRDFIKSDIRAVLQQAQAAPEESAALMAQVDAL
jgi:CDP-glycerol glycerophosphotransferase